MSHWRPELSSGFESSDTQGYLSLGGRFSSVTVTNTFPEEYVPLLYLVEVTSRRVLYDPGSGINTKLTKTEMSWLYYISSMYAILLALYRDDYHSHDFIHARSWDSAAHSTCSSSMPSDS